MTVTVEVGGRAVEVVGATGTSAAAGGPRLVPLCLAKTETERTVLAAWAADLGDNATSTSATSTSATSATSTPASWTAAEAVARAGADDLLLPARVTWGTTGDTAAGRRTREVVLEAVTGRLRGRVPERLLGRGPEACRIVVGEPADLQELQSRWRERDGGEDATDADFLAFVERQADITLDRHERQLRGERYRAPRAVVEEVLTSPGFALGVTELSRRLERSREGVLADVRAYLEEMASEQQRLAIDVWARWAKALYSHSFRLEVDQESLARVRALGASHPLVFLPSHRSNLDPYVMSSLLYDAGMPQNHTLGGINMAFWPIGPLGRRVGVVFIRRSFRDNEIYRFVLQRYLSFLVGKRFNLEWYVEGTRSRTGKLLPPKLGLVNYLVDAVDSLDRSDVYAVPTSITYDSLPEVREMVAESRGEAKPREGLAWLVRYARALRGNNGTIHVRCGEPLNFAETLHALAPAGTPPDSAQGRLARSRIAFEVCVRINRVAPITAPALLLFALLGVEDRALTFAEVAAVAAPVLAYAADRAIPLDRSAAGLGDADGVAATLEFLTGHGLVEAFHDGPEAVYRIGTDQEPLAAFYRNSLLHWFVTRAVVELVLLRAGATPETAGARRAGWQQALALRDLLKFDFFFPDRAGFSAELATELALVAPDWAQRSAGDLTETRAALLASGMLVAHRTLRPFVESYALVAERLEALGSAPADADSLVQDCLGLGRQRRLQRRLHSPDALSVQQLRTAVKLARHRDLLAGGPAAPAARRAFHDELRDVLAQLSEVHDLDRHGDDESGPS